MAEISKIEVTNLGETYDLCDETARDSLGNKLDKSGGTLTGALTTKDVSIQGLEQFGSVYARKSIGTLAAGTKYADLASKYKDGTWHRMWRLRFPAGANYWGKITVHLYGGYSSFNASGWMSKTITCNFNGASLYNNVGYYHNLGINVENDFRISEAIWNSTDRVWEILIWQKNLNGNNSPYVVLEAWASSSTQLESAKGITATAVELTQDTTYTAQKASPTGGDKPVTWADKPVFETPLGEKIGTAVNGVYFIKGTGTTAGTWLGSHNDITKYYNGLMIAYKVGIAGVSGVTTLNINGLGAVSVVRNATTAVTTNYPVNSILFLVYTVDDSKAYWKIADYDANNYAYVRQYHTTNDANYPLLFKYDAGITDTTSYVTKYTRTANNLYFNPSTGTLYAKRFSGAIEGLEEAVEEALTEAKESGDFKGEQGIQGFSFVATVDRPAFTESQWSTYGTIGRSENWGGTSNSGVRVGDLFIVVGTSTDAGNGHMLVYRYTGANNSTTLYGTCIGHHIISAKGATGSTGPQGQTGATGASGAIYNGYGTCSTAAATAAKVITLADNTGWQLKAGSVISVKFTATNTASNPTFNVNGTGAKSVMYATSNITTGNLSYAGYASRTLQYVYNGSVYVFQGWSAEDDYRVTQTARTTDGEFPILLRGTSAGTTTTANTTSFGTKMTANPSTGFITACGFTEKASLSTGGRSIRVVLPTVLNYTNGVLIKLGNTANSTHYAVRITGSLYSWSGGQAPINSIFHFYDYDSTYGFINTTGVNYGYALGAMKVYRYNSTLYVYIPSPGSNAMINVDIFSSNYNSSTDYMPASPTISNSAPPSSGYSNMTTITPTQA